MIEMVYSTDIPAKKENYYRENDIDVIRIHLGSFSQVERIQKMRDYLPLTFVSVTANKDRKKIEEAYYGWYPITKLSPISKTIIK